MRWLTGSTRCPGRYCNNRRHFYKITKVYFSLIACDNHGLTRESMLCLHHSKLLEQLLSMYVQSLSHVPLFVTPWTVACQAPRAKIFQPRILEWVSISSSRGSFQCRDQTCVSCCSCIGRQILYYWAIWAAQPLRTLLLAIGGRREVMFILISLAQASHIAKPNSNGSGMSNPTTFLEQH